MATAIMTCLQPCLFVQSAYALGHARLKDCIIPVAFYQTRVLSVPCLNFMIAEQQTAVAGLHTAFDTWFCLRKDWFVERHLQQEHFLHYSKG
eukprot:605457-Pelagomonas_calceolata.AAC.4